MPANAASQPLSSYFLRNGKIDYQSVMQFARSVSHFLTPTENGVYAAILDRTARYADTGATIRTEAFFEGTAPTVKSAGVMPIPRMSANSFHRIKNKLARLGLIAVEGIRYTILLDRTPLDLAHDEEVQSSICKLHKHNPILRTAEGLLQMAANMTEALLSFLGVCDEEEPEPVENKGDTSYSLDVYIYPSFPAKAGKKWGELIKEFFMGQRTPAQLLSAVQTEASAKASRVREKQQKRGTLADRLAFFKREWENGQRELLSGGVPTRIVTRRDQSNIKTQILRAFEGTDHCPGHFAYWVTANWRNVGKMYFAKAKSYPSKPVLPWLIKCLDTYVEAYEQRDLVSFDMLAEGVNVEQAAKRRIASADEAEKRLQSTATELAVAEAEIRDLKKALNEKGSKRTAKPRRQALPDFDEEVFGYKRKRK